MSDIFYGFDTIENPPKTTQTASIIPFIPFYYPLSPSPSNFQKEKASLLNS